MGISRYNAEGYHDPTAHLAVCHVEEGEKILHLSYPNGSMDIQLFCFFPCTQEKAKKDARGLRSSRTTGSVGPPVVCPGR